MKFRTDFVTNSSSSAFIFEKGLEYKELFQKEDLLGLEKKIKKISDLDSWRQASLFWWFGINEYMYHKKEVTEDYSLLFTVLAYGAELDDYYNEPALLTESGEIKYEELCGIKNILRSFLPEDKKISMVVAKKELKRNIFLKQGHWLKRWLPKGQRSC